MAKNRLTLADVDPERWNSSANPTESESGFGSESDHKFDSELEPQELASETVTEAVATDLKTVADSDAAPVPVLSRSKRQPGRRNTVMIGCHLPSEVSYSLHELCGKLSRKKDERVTIQDLIKEALADVFNKYKMKLPSGLND